MTRDEWDLRITNVGLGLWVGDVTVRPYGQWLTERGIQTVVSCMTSEQHERYDRLHPVPPEVSHRRWRFDDNDVLSPGAIDDIVRSMEGRVLLHCVSGSNRSTALALCWLVRGGLTITAAANNYYAARAYSMSKCGLGVPEMTHQMVANVETYLDYLRTIVGGS